MSLGRRRRTPPLTLVAPSGALGTAGAGAADEGQNTPRTRDWSGLMVRAQDGDRRAYRVLLEDVTPYLRALAARCFKASGDIEAGRAADGSRRSPHL